MVDDLKQTNVQFDRKSFYNNSMRSLNRSPQKKITDEVDEPRNLLNSYAVLLPKKINNYGE